MVRLIRHNILRRRYRILTILLIIVCALIFTFSLSIIFSIFKGVSLYLAGDADELIILSGSSSTPFTGIIDLSLLQNITDIPGVRYVSPELPIPVYLENQPVIARGVEPRLFKSSIEMRIIEGDFIRDGDHVSIAVGYALSKRLGLRAGDRVIITSMMNRVFILMTVKGIVDLPEPYNSELLIPLDTARIIRNTWGNYSSIIRVGVEQDNARSVREEVMDILSSSKKGDGFAGEPGESMLYYLRKYGFDINVLFVALIPPVLVSIVSLRYLYSGLLDEHRDIIDILHGLGYSMLDIRSSYIIQILLHIVAASLIGFLIGYILITVVWRLYDIRFLIHIPPITLPLYTLVLSTVLFTLVSIYHLYIGWRLDEEE